MVYVREFNDEEDNVMSERIIEKPIIPAQAKTLESMIEVIDTNDTEMNVDSYKII
jgi:hypothetical protein